MNNNLDNTVTEVNNAFADYFALVGGKKFKQFYYDWHVDNMMAPFVGMVEYFANNYGDDAQEKFHEFATDVQEWLRDYDVDKPEISQISAKKYVRTKDGKLRDLLNGVQTFGFEFRQFVYSFGTKEDHNNEFGYWPVKANMTYSCKHGLMVAKDLMAVLDKNFADITATDNVYRQAQKVADTWLRANVAKEYTYNNDYTFESRKQHIKQLHDLRNRLSLVYRKSKEFTSVQADLFQVEQKDAPRVKNTYWPNGFELEFYVPEELGDYHVLADYLKDKIGWKKFYFTNKDPSVYADKESAGVIMRDESLVPYVGLSPVEFASRVMYDKQDEKMCLQLFDAFEQGYVNKHCSLHQHLCSDSLDMGAYKRLVKRMMQHEEEIVGAFAAPERRDNNLLYATYISRNLSSQGDRDYPFLALMVDMCDDKTELQEMVSFGNKYKTLNVMPQHTIEMRAMNANFNKKFVEAYLQFNREMVASALENNPHHINRELLNKYTWYNNEKSDDKTVMRPLNYGYDKVPHDSYRPMKRKVPTATIKQEQDCGRMVDHALEETGKIHHLVRGKFINDNYMTVKRGGGRVA